MLDEQTRQNIYDMLDSFADTLAHLRLMEKEELRRRLAGDRRKATETLEAAVSCSLDARISASKLPDEDWLRQMYLIVGEFMDPFQPKNVFDSEFIKLLKYVWLHSEAELVVGMKNNLNRWENNHKKDYDSFVAYFARYPLWGTLHPDQGDYDTLEQRAAVLKRHSYDFLWLYCRLEDYLSRRTLYAILKNWAVLDSAELLKVKSIFPDYYEPDIFPDNEGDIFVDVGAFVGDSIAQYVNTYGRNYKKIYAYEISSDSYNALCKNVARWQLHDVVLRRKGVGAVRGEMFLDASISDASANRLRQGGSTQDRVEVVPLDQDIKELTFLKMDIEGAEQGALLGSERLIRSLHPKLAICTYHGYEDIWKIPLMIDGIYPEYQFYLRHYGGNIPPTEFVLLCKP